VEGSFCDIIKRGIQTLARRNWGNTKNCHSG